MTQKKSMSSRETILKRLRQAQTPFTDVPPVTRRRVTPLDDTAPSALLERFIIEAEALKAFVFRTHDDHEAIAHILELLQDDEQVIAWDVDHIPLHGLADALQARNIALATGDDIKTTRAGITGAAAALATTGSLVLTSGPGKPRGASLLPDVHIAVIESSQILPDLEAYTDHARATWAQPSNIVIVSGASKTADIAMELVMGAHGPRDLHIVILERDNG